MIDDDNFNNLNDDTCPVPDPLTGPTHWKSEATVEIEVKTAAVTTLRSVPTVTTKIQRTSLKWLTVAILS